MKNYKNFWIIVTSVLFAINCSNVSLAFSNKYEIFISVGENQMTVDGKATTIDNEPIEKDGKIYVEINTLKHLKGVEVTYDSVTKKISIFQERPKIYTNGGERSELINLIKTSKTIYIQMYTLTSKEILDAINVASKNKAKIRLILDKSQKANISFDGKNNTEKYIEKNDCIVRWRGGKSGKLNSMHRKMAVFDNKIFYIGSTNWTNAGFFNNYEVGMFYDDKENASLLSNEFLNDWKTASDKR